MSWTAQRADISDPEVVMKFARTVGDQEHLNSLYVLTVADMRGTSPTVWNAWKGRLLSQLYAATRRVLRHGVAKPLDIEKRIADIKGEAAALLAKDRIPDEALQRHWSMLEEEYFLRHEAESLAWHARCVITTRSVDLPLVAAHRHPEHQGIEFLFFTPDREGLFADITGGFDRLNLNIVEVRTHTTLAGFALDVFVVFDGRGRLPAGDKEIDHVREQLRDHLLHPKPGKDIRSAHLPRSLRHFPIPPEVTFTSSIGAQATIMEVTAQDRPGLLYQVALALRDCKARLAAAKVTTFGERAEDVFFITDRDGQPIVDTERLECLEQKILQRLGVSGQTNRYRSPETAAVR
jgi:[protein-PII] uridylyltransferase